MANDTKTLHDIRDLGPCYDPTRYLPEEWQGTSFDLLSVEEIPPQDRIWVVTRWLDDKTNRLFAVWCAREALKLVKNPDPRSVNACEVAERFAIGDASSRELAAARVAAAAAANAADAAWDVADLARVAARAAAAAAWAAAWAAARVAADAAAWDAAWAARANQVEQLKRLIRSDI